MIFGQEVEESSLPARRFVKKAISDFIYLESKVFSIHMDGVDVYVEFTLCVLPNDMKMLSLSWRTFQCCKIFYNICGCEH